MGIPTRDNQHPKRRQQPMPNKLSKIDYKKVLGANVRRLRSNAGMSQDALANDCEMFRTYLSRIENGIANPTILVIANLADHLGVMPSDLVKV
jgi:ribosome-binding protein aMBF1 (putative translation factor)